MISAPISQHLEPMARPAEPADSEQAPKSVSGATERSPRDPQAAMPSDPEAFVKSRRQQSGE